MALASRMGDADGVTQQSDVAVNALRALRNTPTPVALVGNVFWAHSTTTPQDMINKFVTDNSILTDVLQPLTTERCIPESYRHNEEDAIKLWDIVHLLSNQDSNVRHCALERIEDESESNEIRSHRKNWREPVHKTDKKY